MMTTTGAPEGNLLFDRSTRRCQREAQGARAIYTDLHCFVTVLRLFYDCLRLIWVYLDEQVEGLVDLGGANEKVVAICRGLPGSGKSNLAQQVGSIRGSGLVCSADAYFIQDVDGEHVYQYDSKKMKEAHRYVLDALCFVYTCRRLIDLSRMIAGTAR